MKAKKTVMLLAAVVLSVTTVLAKEFKTVVFKVDQMECSNCENKVKNNIKFEKGIKEFKTDLSTRTVTITYDADKTDVEKLQKGFKKFKYEAVPVEGECCGEKESQIACDHAHQ
ncbi:MAG: heavy-metal-associated domain-containing protein [Bacteroides sp.]|nr:heavy-metal-associated domain-containing protein [Bacteroides sp.]